MLLHYHLQLIGDKIPVVYNQFCINYSSEPSGLNEPNWCNNFAQYILPFKNIFSQIQQDIHFPNVYNSEIFHVKSAEEP